MTPLSPQDYQAIFLSTKVAAAATAVSLPFGIACACLMSFATFRGKLLLEVLLNLPLTLPPVVIGYLLLLLLGKNGWLGSILEPLGVRIVFTWKAAVLASAVVGFPLLVRSIRLSMEHLDKSLIHAARSLGAGHSDTFFSIILPLSAPGVFAGSLLMIARSLGEFGATIIVAGNIPGLTQTIPLAIYDYASSPGSEGIAISLCTVSIVLSAGVLLFHEYICLKLRKRG